MPPKRAKSQESDKEICQYHHRGFCKNKEDCTKIHFDKVCDDADCSEKDCYKRHPNPCKFGFRCKFYKLKKCLFSHVSHAPADDDKVKAIFKTFNNKFEKVENEMKKMQNDLKEKDVKIQYLQEKFESLTKSLNKIEKNEKEDVSKLDKKMEALVNKMEENDKSNKAMFSNLEDVKNKFKCEKCKFSTSSEHGLKTHMTKKHKKKEVIKSFPHQCTLCDEVLKDLKEYKKHMSMHSYKYVQYQCGICDFTGGCDIDMEVHLAKIHGDNFECGLCDFEAKDLENLEMHLITCEMFKCGICENRIFQFSNLKKHFQDNHESSEKTRRVTHIKPYRDVKDVYEEKDHTYDSLFPELGV